MTDRTHKIRAATGGVIFFTLVLIAAWDLWALAVGGKDATISGTFADWLGNGDWPQRGLCFALGMLSAHLIGWTKR